MDLCKRRAACNNQLQIVNIMVDTNRVNPCRLQLTSRLEVPDACSRFLCHRRNRCEGMDRYCEGADRDDFSTIAAADSKESLAMTMLTPFRQHDSIRRARKYRQ